LIRTGHGQGQHLVGFEQTSLDECAQLAIDFIADFSEFVAVWASQTAARCNAAKSLSCNIPELPADTDKPCLGHGVSPSAAGVLTANPTSHRARRVNVPSPYRQEQRGCTITSPCPIPTTGNAGPVRPSSGVVQWVGRSGVDRGSGRGQMWASPGSERAGLRSTRTRTFRRETTGINCICNAAREGHLKVVKAVTSRGCT
jgi:hypothetical protein